ncbi:MAG: hypothetical protein JKY61_13020 [Planctomycetes bacterium]|nr:hypothetical protein [Planctomycetota bacterium]
MSRPQLTRDQALAIAHSLDRKATKARKAVPEQTPDWVQSEKIRKAQEKRDRKAKARGVES